MDRFYYNFRHLCTGSVLLEILIALALFTGAGSVILASISNVRMGVARNRDYEIAVDIAVSKISELEAGLVTVEQLNDSQLDVRLSRGAVSSNNDEGSLDLVGSDEMARDENIAIDESDVGPKRWRLEVESEQSRFSLLSVVTIRVFDMKAGDNGDGIFSEGVEIYVLQQLVKLGNSGSGSGGVESEFKNDEIMRGVDRGG